MQRFTNIQYSCLMEIVHIHQPAKPWNKRVPENTTYLQMMT